MPKRTNVFQQVITYIHEQMTSSAGTVKESQVVHERSCNAEREVDILLEQEVLGTKLRIAVECRGRGRKDTLEWIDSLIGKYHDLVEDINKVIAVSRSGFSPDAQKKALAHKIELRTLEEALETQWPDELLKIGLASVTYHVTMKVKSLELDPPVVTSIGPHDTVVNELGGVRGTLDEILSADVNQQAAHMAREYIAQNFLRLYATLEEISQKSPRLTVTLPLRDAYLASVGGRSHKMVSITYEAEAAFEVKPSTVTHQRYNNALIATGEIGFGDQDTTYTVSIVQVPGVKGGQIFVEPKEGAKKESRASSELPKITRARERAPHPAVTRETTS